MRSFVEMPVFVTLALATHLAFMGPNDDAAAQASGAGGDALLSIQASSPSVAAMVEKWEQPPEVMMQAAIPTPPPVADPVPVQPTAPALKPMAPLADAPALPIMSRPETPPPPESAPEAPAPRLQALESSPRPQPRPDRVTPPPEPQRQVRPPKPAPAKPVAQPQPPAPRQAEAPAPAARASAASRAAGQGGQAARGNAGSAEAATLSTSQRNSLLAGWGAKIRARVAQRAPRGVGKGRAVVRITVSGSGQLLGVSLAKSSGNADLDRAALQAVRRAGRFPKAPAKLGISQHSFALPVTAR